MSKTDAGRIADHFAAGGKPLDCLGVARLLGVSPATAAELMTDLEYDKATWVVDIRRQPQRQLHNLVMVGATPQAPPVRVTPVRVKPSPTEVRRTAGREAGRKGGRGHELESGMVTSGRRWPDEEPHLRRAERFRELWPVRARA